MATVALLSTYALGQMPHGLASPAAWLRQAGFQVHLQDLAVQPLDIQPLLQADVIGIYVPMHTATRLALPVVHTIRQHRPDVPIAVYGLYAPLNAKLFQESGVQAVLGGEYEAQLVAFCQKAIGRSAKTIAFLQYTGIEKLTPPIPWRQGLPHPREYAHLIEPNGHRRMVGYVLTTRGCKHRCRHCPVVPVYQGRFRVIPREVVLADITQLVAQGVTHITFGDPDFLNGPGHVMPIVETMHQQFPHLTYDATIKVEHLLRYHHLLPRLKATGCILITTAVETINDTVLQYLNKGHTKNDFYRVVANLQSLGIALQPTFIPFHPWTTIHEYQELLQSIAELQLVPAVPPVQLAIRLLLPRGSHLLTLPEIQAHLQHFDIQRLSYQWQNPHPEVEAMYAEILQVVQSSSGCQSQRITTFRQIWEIANRYSHTPLPFPEPLPLPETFPPYLSENWYCCAEPTESQFEQI